MEVAREFSLMRGIILCLLATSCLTGVQMCAGMTAAVAQQSPADFASCAEGIAPKENAVVLSIEWAPENTNVPKVTPISPVDLSSNRLTTLLKNVEAYSGGDIGLQAGGWCIQHSPSVLKTFLVLPISEAVKLAEYLANRSLLEQHRRSILNWSFASLGAVGLEKIGSTIVNAQGDIVKTNEIPSVPLGIQTVQTPYGIETVQTVQTPYGIQSLPIQTPFGVVEGTYSGVQAAETPYGLRTLETPYGETPYGLRTLETPYGETPYGLRTLETPYGLRTLETPYGLRTLETPYGLRTLETPYGLRTLETPYGLRTLETPYGLRTFETPTETPYGKSIRTIYGSGVEQSPFVQKLHLFAQQSPLYKQVTLQEQELPLNVPTFEQLMVKQGPSTKRLSFGMPGQDMSYIPTDRDVPFVLRRRVVDQEVPMVEAVQQVPLGTHATPSTKRLSFRMPGQDMSYIPTDRDVPFILRRRVVDQEVPVVEAVQQVPLGSRSYNRRYEERSLQKRFPLLKNSPFYDSVLSKQAQVPQVYPQYPRQYEIPVVYGEIGSRLRFSQAMQLNKHVAVRIVFNHQAEGVYSQVSILRSFLQHFGDNTGLDISRMTAKQQKIGEIVVTLPVYEARPFLTFLDLNHSQELLEKPVLFYDMDERSIKILQVYEQNNQGLQEF